MDSQVACERLSVHPCVPHIYTGIRCEAKEIWKKKKKKEKNEIRMTNPRASPKLKMY